MNLDKTMNEAKSGRRDRRHDFVRGTMGAVVAFSLMTVPLQSAQAADVTVTLNRAFLERAVEDAVTQTVIAAEPKLHWRSGRRVAISRKDADSINVSVHLAFDTVVDPNVDGSIEIGFRCFWADPSILLSTPHFDVDVGWPWYIDVATLGMSWVAGHVIDVFVDKKVKTTDKLRQQITATVNQQLGQQGFDFCPAFNVTSGADVQILFGPGAECSAGQTRHKACSSNTAGPGYDDTCINGYWERTNGYCEPVAPPGGSQP